MEKTYLYGGCGSGYVSAAAPANPDGEGGVNCAVTQMWVLVVFKAPFSTAAGDGEDDGGASEVRTGARRRMATAGIWRFGMEGGGVDGVVVVATMGVGAASIERERSVDDVVILGIKPIECITDLRIRNKQFLLLFFVINLLFWFFLLVLLVLH
ncbi:hypothetical protein PIB30_038397 [Stylosanthes scabra]|uniref:Uncharacterized protein n=1 Tax=Stylosanthes scabra TaxID=79078 RepID=A0ABU6TES3_9FABA|nr:hypothetical protein [Stylosanthes scabra]